MDEKCRKIKESITEYVYNELQGELKSEFEAHLNSCPECRQEAEQQKQILSAYQSMKVDFSEDVWLVQRQNIIKKLEAGKKGILQTIFSNMLVRRLSYAMIVMIFIGISTFAYVRHMLIEKEIVKNLDMYQNMDVIEQLDILEHIADNGDNS